MLAPVSVRTVVLLPPISFRRRRRHLDAVPDGNELDLALPRAAVARFAPPLLPGATTTPIQDGKRLSEFSRRWLFGQ